MSKYIFYHIYCNENTECIVKDQVIKILFSGLYDTIDCIYCFLAGSQQYIDIIIKLLQNSGNKFRIEQIGVNDNSYERFTIHKIKNYITENDKILYIHSKGVLRNGCQYVVKWRTFMEYFLFRGHKKCIKLLDEYDTVGVEFLNRPFIHYSGNFWWCRGDYFLKLPDINTLTVTNDRYSYTENYIGLNNPNGYCFHYSNKDLYNINIYPSEYVDITPSLFDE